jgi:DNA replication protein DnaC
MCVTSPCTLHARDRFRFRKFNGIPGQLGQLTDLGWIREHLNLLVTGPTGVGKSYIASAIAHAARRADHSVRCFRSPRLVEELARYAAMRKRSVLYRQLTKADLLVIDDFGLNPLADETDRDLLEILDDRYDKKSTLITSQLPLPQLREPAACDLQPPPRSSS